MADVKQQEVFFTDAHVEVFRHLVLGQHAIVHGQQAQLALPGSLARGFVTQHQGETIIPDIVDRRDTGHRIGNVLQHAVDVNAAAVNRVVIRNHVLQARLGDFITVGAGRQERIAIRSRRCRHDTVVKVVVVHVLTEREVARAVAARISHDVGTTLADVGRHDPGFNGILAGRLDKGMQLFAVEGNGLGASAAKFESETGEPVDAAKAVADQGEVDGRVDAAGVIGDSLLTGLELPQREHVAFVPIAAGGDDAIGQCQRHAGAQGWIHLGFLDAVGEQAYHVSHAGRVGGAVGPAVVLLLKAFDETRVLRTVDVQLGLGGFIGAVNIETGKERCLR